MQANDKPVFINTKFIVYVEPTKIARYHYTEGSLITLSVGDSEGLQTIKVIEPCEVVMKAIDKQCRLAQGDCTLCEKTHQRGTN